MILGDFRTNIGEIGGLLGQALARLDKLGQIRSSLFENMFGNLQAIFCLTKILRKLTSSTIGSPMKIKPIRESA